MKDEYGTRTIKGLPAGSLSMICFCLSLACVSLIKIWQGNDVGNLPLGQGLNPSLVVSCSYSIAGLANFQLGPNRTPKTPNVDITPATFTHHPLIRSFLIQRLFTEYGLVLETRAW